MIVVVFTIKMPITFITMQTYTGNIYSSVKDVYSMHIRQY
jgi:hypothetical protein